MGTKNNPGKFDCYRAAEPDEPMFVLLARDPMAADLVETWALGRELVEGEDSPKAKEARECAKQMGEWHNKQLQDRIPTPQDMKRTKCIPPKLCLACERLGYHLEPLNK